MCRSLLASAHGVCLLLFLFCCEDCECYEFRLGAPESQGETIPKIERLVEASIYVDDLDRAEAFYRDILGLELIGKDTDRHVFFRVGECVLLLFHAEETLKGKSVPAHGAKGPGHLALGVGTAALHVWRRRLEENGVVIEKEMDWPRGGKSFYFRDPAGNSIELITPGCWGLPSGW